MHRSLKTMMLCLAISASLVFAIRNAHADSLANGSHPSIPCEQNPNITPSLQICAFQRDGIRHYQIDTRDGRHVRLAVVNGDVEVLPVGHEVVRVTSSNADSPASGVETVVYRDATLEIGELLDSQNRLTWVVHPMPLPSPGASQGPATLSESICTTAGCGGNHIQSQ